MGPVSVQMLPELRVELVDHFLGVYRSGRVEEDAGEALDVCSVLGGQGPGRRALVDECAEAG